MSCCAPGTEGLAELERGGGALPTNDELWLVSRVVGEGLRQTDMSVPDVHCGTCITTIERALAALPEVEKARVNLSSRRVSFIWKEAVDGVRSDPGRMVQAIVQSGYPAHLYTNAADAGDDLRNQLIRAVAVSGFASVNIMLLSVSVWSGAEAATRDLFHWISALIAAPALIYAGRFFFQSAWNALKNGHTNMDVPISLAVTLSYFMSLYETIHHGDHAWFDASVTLLFFLLIGRTLDHVMRDRARSAITGLARLSPRGAIVVSPDGSREYRPVEDIVPGETLAIAAGERIPVDARILSGESDVDCSIVNGESAPAVVRPGDILQAGTMNLTGFLLLEATATVRDSFLSEIIGLMEAAEGGRARYRRIADRAARYYSPAVHLLALLSFVGWMVVDGDWKHAMVIAISVLIITCPCALGLAVPVVQVVAAGRLFRNGIMVKDGSAMERLAEIDTVLFDKTGTLTVGRPQLVDRGGIDPRHLEIAAALAGHSRHPLSRALSAQAGDVATLFDVVTEIPGAGLEAVTADGVYRLGNRRFACGGDSVAPDAAPVSEVVLSLDGRELQRFGFEDQLRAQARNAVDALVGQGLKTGILSGDRQAVVGMLAARLGIASFKAELSPGGKAQDVAALADAGARVLMVGDGINDAPALARAHVSMAPATAADVGRQAADFVFMHESLQAVPFAVDTARRAGRLIRENFALAIGYNVIAVPIAVAGYVTPLVAAIAMSTSSILVVVNALRLRQMSRELTPAGTDRQPADGRGEVHFAS